MVCSICGGNQLSLLTDTNECIENAFSNIRQRFQDLKNIIFDKDCKLEELRSRNEKLTKAVELLQRRRFLENAENLRPKRRKIAGQTLESDLENLTTSIDTINSSDETSSSLDLNTALNNDELLESSNSSPARTETVEGTEKLRSPRVFRTPSEGIKRRGARKLQLAGLKCDQKSPSDSDAGIMKNVETIPKVIKNVPPNTSKLNCGEQSSPKLKQTVLKFNTTPVKTNVLTTSTTLDDPSLDGTPDTSKASLARLQKRNRIEKSESALNLPTPVKFEGSTNYEQNSLFELRLDVTPKKISSFTNNRIASSTSKNRPIDPSCVLISPVTPEIVFLDDSDENNLNEISKLDRDAVQRILKGPSVQKRTDSLSDTSSSSSFNKKLHIKEEKLTDMDRFGDMDDFDDVMLSSITEETISPVKTPKKSTVKARFNVQCKDCLKYIEFLEGGLSDKEIEEHLRKCTRHKVGDTKSNLTPEGFWNPLLQSFDEDDPRNEVLIDNRFSHRRHVN